VTDCLIEIATPFNTGTGFYIKKFNLIVTNEHVVHDNKEVVIKGKSFEKQMAVVVLIDECADLAFIKPPTKHDMPDINLRLETEPVPGEDIITLGHPYGLNISMTKGVISSIDQKERDMVFIQHDAALNPGNSGGPLIDSHGKVIGINSFVLLKAENIAFALPIRDVIDTFEAYQQSKGGTATRCRSCRKVSYDAEEPSRYCVHCGSEILFPSGYHAYSPVGVPRIIEQIIANLGYDVRLTREGKNQWNIPRGSALVRLSYHKDTGLIDGDAYLCRLPEGEAKAIYTFLMRENFKIKELVFSVKGRFVLLSLMIFDRHLDEDTGILMLERLFDQADHYDDVLVEEYGAAWIEQD